MEWKDVSKLVGKVAPLLGAAVGGPVGGVAGGAIALLANSFNFEGETANNPEKIFEMIQQDPEMAVKLKQIEADNLEVLQRIALERDLAALKDRQNARNREIEIVKATGKRDWFLNGLAGVVTVGFFALCFQLMQDPVPKENEKVFYMLLGGLSMYFGTVLQYYFGSSQSSNEKTKLLGNK